MNFHIDAPKVVNPPKIERKDIEEKLREYLKSVNEASNKSEGIIGSGGAAQVFEYGDSGFCIKVIPDRYGVTDSTKEVKFLQLMSGVSIKGVRSPVHLDTLRTREVSAIVMEQLDAIDMKKVIDGHIPLPESFDLDDFDKSLNFYISHMHERENIVHNDLALRNVMLDKKTGKPRVIDFGNAKQTKHLPKNSRERKILEDRDWEDYEALIHEIEEFMRNRSDTTTKEAEEILRVIGPNFATTGEFNSMVLQQVKTQIDGLGKSDLEDDATHAVPIGEVNLYFSTNPESIVSPKQIQKFGKTIYFGFRTEDVVQ